MGVPLLDEAAGAKRKSIATVGIADLENRSWYAVALRYLKPESMFLVLNDRQECYRPMLHGHLDRKAITYFAVVNEQGTHVDLLLGDADMSGAIMPH